MSACPSSWCMARDSDDIVTLMGDGAHLVGHSYGGLGALCAAARRPAATLSLTLLEPATLALGQHQPAARALLDQVRAVWNHDLPDAMLLALWRRAKS